MTARRNLWLIGTVVVLGACAVGADPETTPSAPALRRVLTVEEVTVRTLRSLPEQLQIEARGTTRTGGWTKPVLRRVEGGKAGLLTLEFVASPPDGIATQAVTPITATTTLPKPDGYRGVVVISETNRKEAR